MPVPPSPSEPIATEAQPEPMPMQAPAAPTAPAVPGLQDLTGAFLANAQALEGVGALQLKLIEALQRGDRSELVLANVQGLNEAFRGLTAIQKSLLERVERLHEPPPAPRASRAVPALLLGIAALLVLCTWALVGAIEDHGRAAPDTQPSVEQAAQLLQAGREEAAAGARQEAERLGTQLRENESRVSALQERLDQERELAARQQREIAAKEAEIDALKRQTAAAQNEALKMSSLENEIQILTQDAALVEPRIRGLEQELADQRHDNQVLRKRLASFEAGYEEPPLALPEPRAGPGPEGAPTRVTSLVGPGARPPAPAAPDLPAPAAPAPPTDPGLAAGAFPEASRVPPPAPEVPAGAASGGEPAPVPAPRASSPAAATPAVTQRPGDVPVTRDRAAVEQVRATLNQLLDGARARRPDSWTLARVDGVAPDRLRGVVAQRLDPAGNVLETVEAREAFLWVDRGARRVSLELVEGVRSVGTQRGEFLQGRMEAVIAEGDAAAVFARSGLQVVRQR